MLEREWNKVAVADVGDILGMFQRHRQKFLLSFASVFIASLILAIFLPPVYRSTATILIEGQEVPGDIVKTTVSGFIDARLEAVEKRVMSHSNLIEIIEDFDLFPEARRAGDLESAVTSVRSNVAREMMSIETVNPDNGREIVARVSFTISYDGDLPDKAQQVANRLAELYMEEHSRLRSEQAKKVSNFIETETEKVKSEILDIEDRLAKFKQKHVGKLPENKDMTLRLLEKAEIRLAEIDDDVVMLAERRRKLVDKIEIETYKKGVYSDGGEVVLGTEQLLMIQKAKLESLSGRYSSLHPDIRKLKSEISILENKLSGPEGGNDGAGFNSVAYNLYDTIYQRQIMELEREIDETKLSRKQVENKISEYENKLLTAPMVEKDYLKIVREHEDALKIYNDLRNRQMNAQMAEQFEVEEKGERLTVVQAAVLPSEPFGPNRIGILLLGFVLAFGFGVGIVAVVDMQDKAVHGIRGVRSLIDMPVIAVIPKISV